jgi:hypothetical protein
MGGTLRFRGDQGGATKADPVDLSGREPHAGGYPKRVLNMFGLLDQSRSTELHSVKLSKVAWIGPGAGSAIKTGA